MISRPSQSRNSNHCSEQDRQVSQASSILDPPVTSLSSLVSSDCLASLTDIKLGARHGARVFRLKDDKRLVGEVRMAFISCFQLLICSGMPPFYYD